MYRIMSSLLMVCTIFLMFPDSTFAVDYSITNVEIKASLQENGNVDVHESHTYSFSGEFNGMIRELIPKTDSDIVDFAAFEHENELLVEQDQTEYRIHRTGNSETITIDLYYQIMNGVSVYSDVAEFYWPFFDTSNESTYEDLTITVTPPMETTDVIAFGYDTAFETDIISESGQVQFLFGEVPSGENGDIRVAYDTSLFPTASLTKDEPMRSEIVAAEQQLIDQAIARAERTEWFASVGPIVTIVFVLILLIALTHAWLEKRSKQVALMKNESDQLLPSQELPLPSTIYFTNYYLLSPESIAASLLDLVRKGNVQQLESDRFRIVNRTGLVRHEQVLVEWLFDTIGKNHEFSFDDLNAYTKNKKNHETYQLKYDMWQREIKDEVKAAQLYKNRRTYRVILSFLSVGLGVFSILLAVHDLFELFILTLGLSIALLSFALFYHPRTWTGEKIKHEWKTFRQRFKSVQSSQWKSLSEDDKMRAFLYGFGSNDKEITKKNEELAKAFQKPTSAQPTTATHSAYSFDPTWILVAGVASSTFQSAQKTTGPDTSSSGGSFTGGGSGAGGGGGGSGAF
ncbi:DUF2207 domain-containing protein [Halalkalibacter sp. AB-rgal2]|uniref:DUF2207 domain-containing protein n=1 Tax=Halalkalibacter sp. AB-rgal2 TaxID=3242695 RepID=UPI00359D583C